MMSQRIIQTGLVNCSQTTAINCDLSPRLNRNFGIGSYSLIHSVHEYTVGVSAVCGRWSITCKCICGGGTFRVHSGLKIWYQKNAKVVSVLGGAVLTQCNDPGVSR